MPIRTHLILLLPLNLKLRNKETFLRSFTILMEKKVKTLFKNQNFNVGHHSLKWHSEMSSVTKFQMEYISFK